MLEIEYVTLGDASERIGVPSATLRHWTDQLEDMEVHFVNRNNRNERIYDKNDIEIFKYLKDMKQEYGRRTTMRDLANILIVKGKEGLFEIKTREEVPMPPISNRTAELMTHEDVKRLLNSSQVQQLLSVMTKEIGESLATNMFENFENLNNKLEDITNKLSETEKQNELLKQKLEEHESKWENRMKERDEVTNQFINEFREKQREQENRGFFSKLFGKQSKE